MPADPILWYFGQDAELHWSWNRMLLDGSIVMESEDFDDYGACINDAMRNGFDPNKHHYSAGDAQGTIDYRRGEPPLPTSSDRSANRF